MTVADLLHPLGSREPTLAGQSKPRRQSMAANNIPPDDVFLLCRDAIVTLQNPLAPPPDATWHPGRRISEASFIAWQKGKAVLALLRSLTTWWEARAVLCGPAGAGPPYYAVASTLEANSNEDDAIHGIVRCRFCDREEV